MYLSNREKKKSILIIVLLLLCIYQLGILWNENNGIPSLFSSQAGNPDLQVADTAKNYLHPGAIIVSEGINNSYWPLDSKNNLYRSIWKDIRESYLKQIVQQPPVIGEHAYEQDWYSLIKMKCILFQFKNPIPAGIIRWVTGTDSGYATGVSQIYKIAIFPSEDINNNQNTLYVFDGETVFKYRVTIEQGYMKKEDYIKGINTIGKNETLIQMERVRVIHPSIKNEELLADLTGDKEKKIWDLLVKTPDELVLKRDNTDQIQEYLFADYKASMVAKLSEDATSVIFTDKEQVGRYYWNGYLDYQYRYKTLGKKGLAEEAFEQALTFIEHRRKDLVRGADIFLTGGEEADNSYIFTFDYVIDDIEIKILSDQNRTVNSAIRIEANRDRVLDVEWYIKTFTYNDFFSFYNLYFYDFSAFFEEQVALQYPERDAEPEIYDFSTSYLYPENGMRAEPYWRVKTESDVIYFKMKGKEE